MRRLVIGHPVVSWVEQMTDAHFGPAVGFGIEERGRLIAGVVFNEYNGPNIHMHVASDGSRRWMTKQLLLTVFDYAFNQVRVKRITGLVGEGNIEAQRFDEHIGFRLETRLKDAHPDGDMLIYVMRREDCRWLNKESRHGQERIVAAAA